MRNEKIKKLSELAKISRRVKKEGKTIGLITGCFDIIHIGHIQLFRYAKKYCDVLIVGLENDKTITLSKGKNRPIHSLKHRTQVLVDIVNIDYVFPIEFIIDFDQNNSSQPYFEVFSIE